MLKGDSQGSTPFSSFSSLTDTETLNLGPEKKHGCFMVSDFNCLDGVGLHTVAFVGLHLSYPQRATSALVLRSKEGLLLGGVLTITPRCSSLNSMRARVLRVEKARVVEQ